MIKNDIYRNLQTGLYINVGTNYALRFFYITSRSDPKKATDVTVYTYWDFTETSLGSFFDTDVAFIDNLFPIIEPSVIKRSIEIMNDHVNCKERQLGYLKDLKKAIKNSPIQPSNPFEIDVSKIKAAVLPAIKLPKI